MLRKLLLVVLPFAMPFLLYGLYYFGLKQSRKGGLGEVPWTVLFISGLALTIVTLFVFGITSVDDPGLTYTPARNVDGVIVPAGSK